MIQLAKATPFLQSLSLSGRELLIDEQIRQTKEYVSQMPIEVPDYFTRIPVTVNDTIDEILTYCTRMRHLDFSGCKWVSEGGLQMIINRSKHLVCFNLLGCSQFSNSVAKLWIYDSNAELAAEFSKVAFKPEVINAIV